MDNMESDQTLTRVVNVDAFFVPLYNSPAIICYLEDNRQFMLSNVPAEIVFAIRKLNNKDGRPDDRENIFDILSFVPEIKQELEKYVEKIVIDSINPQIGVYSASLEVKFGESIVIEKRMIPSHAIYLGLLTGKPIYVRKDLVDEQEKDNQNGEK